MYFFAVAGLPYWLVLMGTPTRGVRVLFFFFQAEDGIRDVAVTGVQTCALPIWRCFASVRSSGWKRPGRGAPPSCSRGCSSWHSPGVRRTCSPTCPPWRGGQGRAWWSGTSWRNDRRIVTTMAITHHLDRSTVHRE